MKDGKETDIFTRKAWEDFAKKPCVKSSYLWGIGCGAIMAAHKMRLHRNFSKAVNAAFFTFAVVTSASFCLCAAEVNQRYEMLQKAFKIQHIKEDRTKRD